MSSSRTRSAASPAIGVCVGKDCRKRDEHADLLDAIDDCEVLPVRCLGICSGPVVAVAPRSDDPVVYSKVRTKKQRKQLRRLVHDARPAGTALAGREVSGSKRSKALRRLSRDV